jgi:hypothetical protein
VGLGQVQVAMGLRRWKDYLQGVVSSFKLPPSVLKETGVRALKGVATIYIAQVAVVTVVEVEEVNVVEACTRVRTLSPPPPPPPPPLTPQADLPPVTPSPIEAAESHNQVTVKEEQE